MQTSPGGLGDGRGLVGLNMHFWTQELLVGGQAPIFKGGTVEIDRQQDRWERALCHGQQIPADAGRVHWWGPRTQGHPNQQRARSLESLKSWRMS